MRPVILFRASLAEQEEMEICKKYFPVITQRTQVRKGDLVIPRYSSLPWYQELENDIEYNGGKIINTFRQHDYVADIRNWYLDLESYTPHTWFLLEHIPNEGPFVLKGQTNSKKHSWKTHMFAKNKPEAIQVYNRLSTDGHIGYQHICVRQFVSLKKYSDGIQGLPITEEYRFFVLDGKVLSSAFYWSEHTDFIKELGYTPNPKDVPQDFIQQIISIVSPNIRFFVVDVARTESGNWIVIELNDGTMSGLSDNDPDVLYKNMSEALK